MGRPGSLPEAGSASERALQRRAPQGAQASTRGAVEGVCRQPEVEGDGSDEKAQIGEGGEAEDVADGEGELGVEDGDYERQAEQSREKEGGDDCEDAAFQRWSG